jgi:LmbE family N-acetylglucosaminyl deacetylase
MSTRTLMAVFAHPDDEAFGTGGTLTRYAAEGCDVYLVTATRGEAGEIAGPGLAIPANLPQVREEELRCACQIYGIHPLRFLDYVDGQLAIVHQGQAVGKRHTGRPSQPFY